MLIDAHNHLQDPRFEENRSDIIATLKSSGINQCVVNGTSESDWAGVAELASSHPDFIIPSFGLHPWKTSDRSERWEQTLIQYLEKFPSAGIGECGLDRWIQNYNIDDQRSVFRSHLSLAPKFSRPLTIHCLRAWGPLLEELRNASELPRILLHSFNGSLETARELVKLGAYFSFSGHFFHPRKEALREVFRQLPPDRILLETDAPDMLPPQQYRVDQSLDFNHPINLTLISKDFYEEFGISLIQIAENTHRFFKNP